MRTVLLFACLIALAFAATQCDDFQGLHGVYYPVDYTGVREGTDSFLELDENVDHFWDFIFPPFGSPHGKSQYGATWTGEITFPTTGIQYTFYVYADDGVTIEIDGATVFDKYKPQILRDQFTYTPATSKQSIEVDYYQRTGNATMILHWSYGAVTEEPVPMSGVLSNNVCYDDTPTTPDNCASLELFSYEYTKATGKTKFCYLVDNPSTPHGPQCDLTSVTIANHCNVSPTIQTPTKTGYSTFPASTKAQFCLQYNGHVTIGFDSASLNYATLGNYNKPEVATPWCNTFTDYCSGGQTCPI